MSTPPPAVAVAELPSKTLAEFLESTPPNSQVQISDLFKLSSNSTSWLMRTPDIQLHCTSDQCSGTRTFRNTSSNYLNDGWNFEFSTYVCRNCEETHKTYALAVFMPKEKAKVTDARAMKLGETPPFGPHVPSRVITLIGPDREEFLLGRRAESLGLGIGAFAYYRRVVEAES